MISLNHIYKTYPGPVHALRNISFSLGKGEFAFLTGVSGAGKTTLFRILGGFDTCTSGEIEVAGYKLHDLRTNSLALSQFRRSVGIVFQDYRLIRSKTLVENVSLPLVAQGKPRKEALEAAEQALISVGLAQRLHQYPESTSGGEQQRAAVARALIHEPRVVLADEPTGNLDPKMAEEIMALLEKASHRGSTVFVVSHDWNLVRGSGKRHMELEQGTIKT